MLLLPKSVTLLKPERIENLTRTRVDVVKTYNPEWNDTLEIDFTWSASCLSRQWPAFLYVKDSVVFIVVVAFGMC